VNMDPKFPQNDNYRPKWASKRLMCFKPRKPRDLAEEFRDQMEWILANPAEYTRVCKDLPNTWSFVRATDGVRNASMIIGLLMLKGMLDYGLVAIPTIPAFGGGVIRDNFPYDLIPSIAPAPPANTNLFTDANDFALNTMFAYHEEFVNRLAIALGAISRGSSIAGYYPLIADEVRDAKNDMVAKALSAALFHRVEDAESEYGYRRGALENPEARLLNSGEVNVDTPTGFLLAKQVNLLVNLCESVFQGQRAAEKDYVGIALSSCNPGGAFDLKF
jgi:hypothetical protein